MMAMICGADSVRTMAELDQDAVRMAEELVARGVRPGERVMLKADNSVAYVTALLGLMHLGASIVLLDHQETADTTARMIRQAGVTLCVTDEDTALPEDLPRRLSLYELQLAAAGRTPSGRALDVRAWGDRPDGLLMCSSGSTGTPKVIVKTGRSFLENLRRNYEQVGHVQSDVLAPLLPFSHQYGLSMVLIAWLVRCSLVVAPYRRPDHALRMAGLCGVTVFDATPAVYRTMLNIARRRPPLHAVLSGARMLCVGAAPLEGQLVDSYLAEIGHPLLDSYGSTELGNVAFATLDEPVACGRAVEGVKVIVVDGGGQELGPGEVGEIMVLTPDVMSGYLDEDGQLHPATDGWYATNDIGALDAGGNLTVLGRKRAVHRMGYTLHPAVIERRVESAGCSVKIVVLPDDRTGAQLIAFVEDEDGRGSGYWRERMESVLPAYEMPNRVVVMERFPLTHTGKPDGKRLEQLAATA